MVALVGLTGSSIGWSCGSPPTRMGGSLLDFGTTGPTQGTITRLSLGTAAPFYHWDFRSWALEGNRLGTNQKAPLDPFILPQFALHDPFTEPGELGVFARYNSEHAFWTTSARLDFELHDQHEILLFARDPQEHAATMRAFAPSFGTLDQLLSQFPFDWLAQWPIARVPGAATFVYPPQAGWNGNDPNAIVTTPVTVSPITRSLFGTLSFLGPAAEPGTFGSVKAAKIVNHGMCSRAVPYSHVNPNSGNKDGILELLADQLPVAFAKTVLNAHCPTGDVESLWTTTSSWLDFTQEREDAQLGGFFLNLAVNVKVTIFKAGPRLAPRSVHQWRLLDGRLTADGEMLSTGNRDGTDNDSAVDDLTALLTRQLDAPPSPNDSGSSLAAAIFHQSDEQQVFTGDIGTVTCDVSKSDDGSIPIPDTKAGSTDECHTFWSAFTADVNQAFAGVGPLLGINASGQQQVLETMNATELKNNKLVSKNLRCVHRASNGTAREGTCEYVLRAKRLNPLPDAVDLVFVDDTYEYSNPTFPLWLHLLELKRSGISATAIDKLCDPPVTQFPGTTSLRLYKNHQRPHRNFFCSSCSNGCAFQEGP